MLMKLEKEPKVEELLINKKIPLHKITINRQSIFNNKSQTIRWYLPDWNKIINSGILLDLLIEKNYLLPNQRGFHSNITQIYLLLTFLPASSTRRENYTGRRTRKFNINTLLYNPIYHEDLFSFEDPSPGKIKAYLRQLTKKEKEKRLEKIIRTKVYPFLDTKTPIKELIHKAFSEKELGLPLSRMGDEYFTRAVFDNALKILKDKFIGRDLNLNPISKKDIEYIRENILPDPIIKELRNKEIDSILRQVEDLYKTLLDSIKDQKHLDAENKSFNKKKYLQLSNRLINFLEVKKKRKFKKEKIFEIDQLIQFTSQMRDLPDEDKWKGLMLIRDRFYDHRDSLYSFVNKLDKKVKKHLINFSRIIFHDLVTQENLNREERRLFIISNIGLQSFDHAILVFERNTLDFFTFNKFILTLFIEVVLNRNLSFDTVDLKNHLDYQWRIFLNFYGFWHNEIKSSEQERKRHSRERKVTERLAEGYHKDKNALDPNDLTNLIGCDEELLIICTEREVRIYTEKELHKKSLKEIAKEDKVSPQMISKIYNRAKKKIIKHYSK